MRGNVSFKLFFGSVYQLRMNYLPFYYYRSTRGSYVGPWRQDCILHCGSDCRSSHNAMEWIDPCIQTNFSIILSKLTTHLSTICFLVPLPKEKKTIVCHLCISNVLLIQTEHYQIFFKSIHKTFGVIFSVLLITNLILILESRVFFFSQELTNLTINTNGSPARSFATSFALVIFKYFLLNEC